MCPLAPVANRMTLHDECVERLRQITLNALQALEVRNGCFLKSSAFELFEPGNVALPKESRKALAEAVSEHPFSTFAFGFLQERLEQQFSYEDAPPKHLTSLAGYEELTRVSNAIVDAFLSLPWQYAFIFKLPLKASYLEGVPEADQVYSLAGDVSLVRAGRLFRERFPLPSSGSEGIQQSLFSLSRHQPESWSSDYFYLVHTTKGYVLNYLDTQPVKAAGLLLRAVGGLLQASGFAVARKVYSPSSVDGWIHVYKEEAGGQYTSVDSHRFDADYTEFFRSLQWIELPKMPEEMWNSLMNSVADLLRPAFAESETAMLLRRCSQWYFDSLCGSNRLLQFVQATVAIEILLGDKPASDLLGLGELLANRCAYSLADSHDERSEILKDFRSIYDTRSQIVHRGKIDLTDAELDQLARLWGLCGRLVRKELNLLEKS